jgi:dienelactone hydrolase
MEYISYKEEKSEYEIILVRGGKRARPTILIAHAWSGRDAFVEEAAHRFAELGYTACVLDLARAGAPIRAAISVHGLLAKAPHDGSIKPAVLALHGDLDPMVSQEQVKGWCDEMRASGASWQLHTFGGVFHAFTNPEANDREGGLLYNEKAAALSWQMIDAFFERSL